MRSIRAKKAPFSRETRQAKSSAPMALQKHRELQRKGKKGNQGKGKAKKNFFK